MSTTSLYIMLAITKKKIIEGKKNACNHNFNV